MLYRLSVFLTRCLMAFIWLAAVLIPLAFVTWVVLFTFDVIK